MELTLNPLKRQSPLQQTTFLWHLSQFFRYYMRTSRRFSWNIMPYLLFLKKQQNLKLSSAANYWWRFKGLSPPVKYFTDRSKAVLLLWIFYVFVLSCVCYVLCASVYMCFVVTCWERADLLALVCGVFCEFGTFPLVSWVRCGTWLYRFLIFATLLTFKILAPARFMQFLANFENSFSYFSTKT